MSSNSDQTLYEILGVPPGAKQEQIEAAYNELVRQCLREEDSSPDVLGRMVRLGNAYEVLSDKGKRATYNARLVVEQQEGKTARADATLEVQHFTPWVRCQGCGKFDHTLRNVAFPYVLSFVIGSSKRHSSGVFCHKCRSAKSLKYALVSLLFGPWGLPWGIIWTLRAIINNYRGGRLPTSANHLLLWQLVDVSRALGRIAEAKAALHELIEYGRDEGAERLRRQLDAEYPTVGRGKQVSTFRLGFILVMLTILLGYGAIGFAIVGRSFESATPVSTSETTVNTSGGNPDTTPSGIHDTVLPVISNVMASAVTGNSANITWTTNERATSQVEYGLTDRYGSQSDRVVTVTTTHAFAISGLQYGSTYHYRVKSADAAGNESMSYDSALATLPQITAEGFKVFYSAQPQYRFSDLSLYSAIELVDNDKASNPTWQQVVDFLERDTIDGNAYLQGIYMCGHFARDIHNNAEAAGIRAGIVCLSYTADDVGHALNVFETRDRGLAFIDCTGEGFSIKPIPPLFISSKSYGDWEDNDKVAYVDIGKPLGLVSADVAQGPSYNQYEQWQQDMQRFRQKLDAHNTACQSPYSDYYTLKAEEQALDDMAAGLGGFWEQQGIVESVEIYW